MVWSTAQINDEANKNEAENGEDLHRRKPEFAFTKGPSSQKIDGENDETGNSNPHSVVDLAVPVYKRPWEVLALVVCGKVIERKTHS